VEKKSSFETVFFCCHFCCRAKKYYY